MTSIKASLRNFKIDEAMFAVISATAYANVV